MQTLRLELPAIVIASATLLAFAWDGTLSRLEGLVLVTMGVVFTLACIRAARRESLKVKLEFAREFGHRRFANRQVATEMLMLATTPVIARKTVVSVKRAPEREDLGGIGTHKIKIVDER